VGCGAAASSLVDKATVKPCSVCKVKNSFNFTNCYVEEDLNFLLVELFLPSYITTRQSGFRLWFDELRAI
jgi:hypothetical protein